MFLFPLLCEVFKKFFIRMEQRTTVFFLLFEMLNASSTILDDICSRQPERF